MMSDFSINALLNLPREEVQIPRQGEDNGKLGNGCGIGVSKPTQEQVHGEEEDTANSSMRCVLGATSSTRLFQGSSQVENRFPPEFTTIVIPRKEIKPKRKRTAFSNIQLYFLEQFFQKKAYPSGHERNFIASILSIGSGQVKTWFQNRRTKWKKNNFADFEKQPFVDTPCFGAVNPSWPGMCNQGLCSPSFRPTVINSSHLSTQVSYF